MNKLLKLLFSLLLITYGSLSASRSLLESIRERKATTQTLKESLSEFI